MKRTIKADTSGKFREARERLSSKNIERIASDLEQFIVDLRYSKDVQALIGRDAVITVDEACDILYDLARSLSSTPGFD